jgi:hypothetical protein
MKTTVAAISFSLSLAICAQAQEIKLVKYELKTPPVIGTRDGVTIHEGGISGLHFIRGSENEFYLITDRGPNADASAANAGKETILFAFPDYAPKIFKARAEGDSLRIVETLTLKKSGGANASGIPHPVGLGNTGEVAWVDTNKTLANLDAWGIDSECIVADHYGDFWIGDEFGPTIWRVNGKTGEVIKRYTPFVASAHEVTIDSVLAKRRPNRGFRGNRLHAERQNLCDAASADVQPRQSRRRIEPLAADFGNQSQDGRDAHVRLRARSADRKSQK